MDSSSSNPSSNSSPSPYPMDLDQPGPSMKRKIKMEVDEPEVDSKAFKLEPQSCQFRRPLSDIKDEIKDFQEMENRIKNIDDAIELHNCFEHIYLNLDMNVDYDATPLDAVDLHYCILCESHLGKFQNVLYSKVQFHMHCVIVHKLDICKFKPCMCYKRYKIEVESQRQKS